MTFSQAKDAWHGPGLKKPLPAPSQPQGWNWLLSSELVLQVHAWSSASVTVPSLCASGTQLEEPMSPALLARKSGGMASGKANSLSWVLTPQISFSNGTELQFPGDTAASRIGARKAQDEREHFVVPELRVYARQREN